VRRPSLIGSVVAVLVAAALPGGAIAAADPAADPLSPPPLDRYLRWGPIRARPGVALVDVGWDGNVFRSSQTTGDYRGTLAPRLDALVLFGRTAFVTADLEARYTAYASYSELNYLDLLGESRVTVPFGRVGAYAEFERTRVRETPADLDDVRPRRDRFRRETGALFRASAKTVVEAGVSVTDDTTRDDDFGRTDIDVGDLLDRRESYAHLRARYRATGRSTVSVEVLDGKVRFDTPNVVGEPGYDRDARETRVLPAVHLAAGGPLSGDVRIGWARIDYRGALIADFSGVVGEADLAYRFASRWTARVGGDRDIGFSVSTDNAVFVRTRARLGVEARILRWLSAEGAHEFGTLRIDQADRKDDLRRTFGGVGVRLPGAPGLYRVRVGRESRESNLEGLDRSRTFVTVTVDLGS